MIAPLVLGMATFGGFVLWQKQGPKVPLMPCKSAQPCSWYQNCAKYNTVHIFRSSLVVGACLTMFINGWLFVTQVYYIPSFYQLVYGMSAVKSGALLLPITLTQTLSSTSSGLIVHWTGRYRESIIVGWAAWAIGNGLYSTLDDQSLSLGQAIGYGMLTGFGVGQTLQPSLIAIQAGVKRQDMAVVTCTRNFVRNLGSTLGLAISATLVNSLLQSSAAGYGLDAVDLIDDPTRMTGHFTDEQQAAAFKEATLQAYSAGFRRMFYLNAALATLGCGLAMWLIPQIELSRPDDDTLREQPKDDGSREK